MVDGVIAPEVRRHATELRGTASHFVDARFVCTAAKEKVYEQDTESARAA